jgi:hypothetical protein
VLAAFEAFDEEVGGDVLEEFFWAEYTDSGFVKWDGYEAVGELLSLLDSHIRPPAICSVFARDNTVYKP